MEKEQTAPATVPAPVIEVVTFRYSEVIMTSPPAMVNTGIVVADRVPLV